MSLEKQFNDGQSVTRVAFAIRLLLSGFMAGTLAVLTMKTIITWLRELLFYWGTAWNFDLPHPAVLWQSVSEPPMADGFGRLLFGWPFQILWNTAATFTALYLVKLVVWPPAPMPRAPTPRFEKLFFWGVISFATTVIFVLVAGHS